jgi:type II secretory ATPase GspE/PulE/Tfp pilus assembly ATPase PilB-like protein
MLCVHCKEAYAPSLEERQLLGREVDGELKIFRPVGCNRCNHRGYRGRTAVMEILHMDADLDELVARRASPKEMRDAALSKNFRALAEEGVQRVVDGSTSLAEVARAIDLTGRAR